MSRGNRSNYAGNADLIVDIFVLIIGVMYIIISKMLEGAREYLASKKEVDNEELE
jgi:hypothetical protein